MAHCEVAFQQSREHVERKLDSEQDQPVMSGVESHVDHIENGITSSILADRRAQKFMHKQLDNEF